MSTTAVPDKKGIVSSLSADAAEFVPLAAPPSEEANVKGELTSEKGGLSAPVQVRDVPQFLTSCFPFVQLNGELRSDAANQFSLPLQFPGIPQTVPMPSPTPVGLPAEWQSIRPELIGGFPPQPGFGSLPYMNPLANAVSLAQERSQGEGLLPTPVGLPLPPGLHNSPGLILTAQPGHLATSPWLLTSAPPPLVPQAAPSLAQQQQHSVFVPSQQQQLSLVSVPSTMVTTVTTSSCTSVSTSVTSHSKVSKTTTSCAVDNRASSPVYISRSAQTYLPKQIHNFTLKEKPHPLYTRNHGKHKHRASNEQDQDSDSGYNSPLQPKKLISCGTQVFSGASSPRLVNSDTQENLPGGSTKTATGIGPHVPHPSNEAELDKEEMLSCESKKKDRKKKENRAAASLRSPHSLGSSNSKLLSRSSSSISSAGTRHEEDDEKIDLHSWTDFPPMMPKTGAGSVVSRPVLSPTAEGLVGHADRVPLTIERTAHAPPWSIKYTSRSGNVSCSSNMEKEKSSNLVTSSGIASDQQDAGVGIPKSGQESQHSKSSAAGSGKELLRLTQGGSAVSKTPTTVHKPNATSAPATTLNSSPETTTITTTSTTTTSRMMHPSVAAPSLVNKSVPYSQIMKGPSPAPNLPNSGYSMIFPPPTALTGTKPISAFPGPAGISSIATPGHVPLSVPPPIMNKQNLASVTRQHAPHMAFSSPPPHFRTPPPPLNTPHRGFNPTTLVHSTTGVIPVPPLYNQPPPLTPPSMLGQRHPIMRPNYPPPSLPGFQPQGLQTQKVTAPTSRAPPVHPNQWTTRPNLEPGSSYAGTAPHSQEYASQTNTSVKSSLHTPQVEIARPPQANSANINKSSPNSTTPALSKLAPQPKPETALIPQQPAQSALSLTEVKDEDKKRRRRRRRRGRGQGIGGAVDSAREGSPGLEHAISSSNISESTLHFEDVDEFPDLVGASRGYLPGEDAGADRATLSGTSLSYSDVIKATWSKASSQSRTQSLTGSCISGDDEDNASNHTGTSNLSKRARKRRRRREQANKAAEAELAEITLEQQWLQQVGLRKSPTNTGPRGLITNPATVGEAKGQTGGKKFQQPIAFDIAAMIDAIQKKPAPQPVQSGAGKTVSSGKSARKDVKEVTGNLLDSTAPLQKRGKEREVPKTKKPSPLKKVILKEREQRKRLRLLDGDPDSASSIAGSKSGGVGMIGGESELSQEALSSKSEGTDEGEEVEVTAELSADLSPISQTSPISMSPASPGNSGVSSPSAGSIGRDPVIMKIHSRRFREYCTQILDKEIDQCCTSLLQELVKFQDRMYHKDPVKAKSKRRVVLGLREVTKHLKLKRIKCVVISPNLEKIQSKGGLDEALNTILTMCQEQNVPFVFALGRRALGRACAKLVPVSVVGIFNYEGCESKYHSLISLTAAARDAYHEMVHAVEREVAEHPASQASSISGVPGLFAAHMGHSRTPSGCSAISFTSSILSEPISENFPHAEPEVDSKGYEIVRDAAGNVVHSQEGTSKGRSPNDIDDGNEADVEDLGEMRKKKRTGRNLNSVRFGCVGAAPATDKLQQTKSDTGAVQSSDATLESNSVSESAEKTMRQNVTGSDGSLKGNRGMGQESPHSPASVKHRGEGEKTEVNKGQPIAIDNSPVSHIDSIHSLSYNLGEAILSQHTSLPKLEMAGTGSSDFEAVKQKSSPRSANINNALHNSNNSSPSQEIDNDDDDDLRISAVDDDSNDENYEDEEDEDDDDNEDDDNVDDNDEGEENEDIAEPVRSHQRIIDKERIKSWLESQTSVAPED